MKSSSSRFAKLMSIGMVSVAVTLATASVGFGMTIVPGTVPFNDPSLTPHGGGGGALPPEKPGYPPRNPLITGPVSRTTTALTVRLWDRSSYEQGYELYRGPSKNGPWTVIAFMTSRTGQFDFADNGLSPDTEYCYLLTASNAYGISPSSGNCFSTLDGRSVWRVQLRLRTANVEHAETDNSVYVALNGPNLTWLDYAGDDFARGDEFTYDLLPDGVSDLADIETIFIHKEGTDGWCIESLALLVNSREYDPITGEDTAVEIYNQEFGATPSTCLWIDKATGHKDHYSVSRSTLRAHPLWQMFQQPNPPLFFPAYELESRIESIVGDSLHSTDAYWGDLDGERYVEVSRKDNQAVQVSLDLVAEVPLTRNPEVDVSFDLRFSGSCTEDGQTPLQLHVITENIRASADADWWEEVATFWINFLEGAVADAVVRKFPDLERTISLNPGTPTCITPEVDGNGNVRLTLSFSSPTPKPPIQGGGGSMGPIGGTYQPATGGVTTGTFTTGGTVAPTSKTPTAAVSKGATITLTR